MNGIGGVRVYNTAVRVNGVEFRISFFNTIENAKRGKDHVAEEKEMKSWSACLLVIYKDHLKAKNFHFWYKLPRCKYIKALEMKGLIYEEFACVVVNESCWEILIR